MKKSKDNSIDKNENVIINNNKKRTQVERVVTKDLIKMKEEELNDRNLYKDFLKFKQFIEMEKDMERKKLAKNLIRRKSEEKILNKKIDINNNKLNNSKDDDSINSILSFENRFKKVFIKETYSEKNFDSDKSVEEIDSSLSNDEIILSDKVKKDSSRSFDVEKFKGKYYYHKTEDENLLYRFIYNSHYKRKKNYVVYLKCSTKTCSGRGEIELSDLTEEIDTDKIKITTKCDSLQKHDHNLQFIIWEKLDNNKFDDIDLNSKESVELIYEWIFINNRSFSAEDANRHYLSIFNKGIALNLQVLRNIKNRIKMRNNLEQTFDERMDKIKDPDGKEFLEYKISYSNNADEIRFFCNNEMKNNLNDANIKQWYFDFTYYSCPINRNKIRNVGVMIGEDIRNGSLKLGFLTISKKETVETIEVIFNLVYFINKSFSPECIVIDFSKALLKLLDRKFPSKVIGCFFHFCQALWKKSNSLGLRNAINAKKTKELIFELKKLCFIKFSDIDEEFNAIYESFNTSLSFKEFF